MDHMDEQFLKAKKQMEEKEAKRHSDETIAKELEQSIYDEEIAIYGVPVQFIRHNLLDEQVSLMMPKDFEALPEKAIAEVYFLGNKPQYMYANDYLYFSVGLNYTTNAIPNEAIGEFGKLAKGIIEKVGPKVKAFKTDKFQVGDYQIATVEFISQAIDQSVYNQMFYASLKGKLLIGFVNFPYKYVKRLRKVADEIIRSVEIKEVEEGEE